MIYTLYLLSKSRHLFVVTLLCALTPLSLAQNENESLEETSTADAASEESPKDDPTTTKQQQILPRFMPNLEESRQRDFLSHLDPDALITLATPDEEFAALWEYSKIDKQYGAVLLLPPVGLSPDKQGSTNLLRQSLTEYGWSVLSISLPVPLPVKIPKRPTPLPLPTTVATTDEEDSNQETNTESKPEKNETDPAAQSEPAEETQLEPVKVPAIDIENQVAKRFAAAIDYLHQKGQFNIIVIGEGLGALRSAKLVDDMLGSTVTDEAKRNNKVDINKRPIRAMVLVNARNQFSGVEGVLPSYLNFIELPILDIYLKQHYLDELEPKARLRQTKLNRHQKYFQLGLKVSSAQTQSKENIIVRRIRGFLNKHAKGVEIDR